MKTKNNLFSLKKVKPMKIRPVRPQKIVKSAVQVAVGMAALGIALNAFDSVGN